jgi:hypothetical protein
MNRGFIGCDRRVSGPSKKLVPETPNRRQKTIPRQRGSSCPASHCLSRCAIASSGDSTITVGQSPWKAAAACSSSRISALIRPRAATPSDCSTPRVTTAVLQTFACPASRWPCLGHQFVERQRRAVGGPQRPTGYLRTNHAYLVCPRCLATACARERT